MYIYGLADPRRPQHYNYIGKTISELNVRLGSHIRGAKKSTFKNAQWINHLIKTGYRPLICLIETVKNLEDLDKQETYYIEFYRNKDQAENNHLDGGNGFTSATSKEVQRLKAIRKSNSTVAETKCLILSLQPTERRPDGRTTLGAKLSQYISTKGGAYDAEFSAAVRARFPLWFCDKVEQKKKELLALPLHSPKPVHRSYLHTALKSYTLEKNRKSYDKDFAHQIYQRQPHWKNSMEDIRERRVENKAQILKLPSDSVRPNRKSELGRNLPFYTCRSSRLYDFDFHTQIQTRFPHWLRGSP